MSYTALITCRCSLILRVIIQYWYFCFRWLKMQLVQSEMTDNTGLVAVIQECRSDLMVHPWCSPDLATLDYHPFTEMGRGLCVVSLLLWTNFWRFINQKFWMGGYCVLHGCWTRSVNVWGTVPMLKNDMLDFLKLTSSTFRLELLNHLTFLHKDSILFKDISFQRVKLCLGFFFFFGFPSSQTFSLLSLCANRVINWAVKKGFQIITTTM